MSNINCKGESTTGLSVCKIRESCQLYHQKGYNMDIKNYWTKQVCNEYKRVEVEHECK